VKSALGGSSTALIALLKALSKLSVATGGKKCSGREILHMGYHLEDGVSGGNCGIQDQAAAVYGGVNRWTWRYGERVSPFMRARLLDMNGQRELSKRILVAFSGKGHASLRINRAWINDFLSGVTRSGWVKVNEVVNALARAIKAKEWDKAARLLKKEMAIRRDITPDALIPITEELVDRAENAGCGARFAGAGGGGTVWALGEMDRINDLRKIWEGILTPIRGGRILECEIDPMGTR
jgi:D-glycero-alpha-D-manno-heptose-7-phosphate kinase